MPNLLSQVDGIATKVHDVSIIGRRGGCAVKIAQPVSTVAMRGLVNGRAGTKRPRRG
jgi:hypothetical protein